MPTRHLQHVAITLIGVGTLACGLPHSWAVDLAARVADDDVCHVKVELEVGGHLQVRNELEGQLKQRQVPMSVSAAIRYDERLVSSDVADSAGQIAALRYYHQAEATLKSEDGGDRPTLPDEHRLIAVVTTDGPRQTLSSMAGPLERRQLDLIDVVGNTVLINRLLPGEGIGESDTWQLEDDVIAAFLGLDSVAVCEVESVVDKMGANFVQIRLAGVVHGTVDGAATEIELRSVYLFSHAQKRITKMNLALKEKRSLGDATPGLDVVAKIRIGITPSDGTTELSDQVVARALAGDEPIGQMLRYFGQRQGLQLLHDRNWFVTGEERESVTLRRVVAGDLVAHCTIKRLPPKSADRQATIEQFQKDVKFALGESFEHFASSAQWTATNGHRCYRVVARGKVQAVPVQWHNYLVAAEDGKQASLAFTMEGPDADRLGDADRELVEALQLVEPTPRATATASKGHDSGKGQPTATDIETVERAARRIGRRPYSRRSRPGRR